jgi:hypothetical protein
MADKIVMVGERKYRLPFIDLIPFEESQNADLGKAIEQAGKVLVPIVCWKERKTSTEDVVVDGAHRVLHASRLEFASIPKIYRSFEDEEEAKAECEAINLERRHLSPNELTPAREKRIKRIAEMRAKGESLRAIAAAENTSETQVRRDLEESGAPGGGAPDGKVTGKDGKAYPALKLCKRCKRIGAPVKDCQMCAKVRKKAKSRSASNKSKPHDPLKDHFGNEVPQKRRVVWADTWIQTTYDFLTTFSEKFRMEKIGVGMNKRAKFYPFFDAKEFNDGVGFVIQYLDALIEHMKENRPAGVCPKCSGEGCGTCRNSGLVPRAIYEKAK